MSAIQAVRPRPDDSLPALATEINAAHSAALDAARSALENARRAGMLLVAAKEQLPHGEWLPWLALHCPTLPERTARAYMRVARCWPEIEAANRQRVADLPLRDALKLLTVPRADDGQPSAESSEFPIVDYIEMDYRCPRCSFEWSGNPKPPTGRDDAEGTVEPSTQPGCEASACCKGGDLQLECKLCRQSPTYWRREVEGIQA
jgi:hypothetical protein